MRSKWAGSLGLSLGIWVAGAAGQEAIRRPIAATPTWQGQAATSQAAVRASLGRPVPAATLGMPTSANSGIALARPSLDPTKEQVVAREPVKDGRVAPASFQPIAATPGSRIVRAQDDSPPALLGNLTEQDPAPEQGSAKLRRFSENSLVKRVQGFFYGGQAPVYGNQAPAFGGPPPAQAMPFAYDDGDSQCMECPGSGPCCSPAVPFNSWGGAKCCQFFVGGGVYVLKPHYDDGNVAFFREVTTYTGNNTTTTTNSYSFGNKCEAAPIVWLGWSDPSGLGIRARWWHLDQSNDLDTSAGPLGDNSRVKISGPDGSQISGKLYGPTSNTFGFAASQELNIHVWDIEATQDIKFPRWALQIATGLRYARLDQSYAASLISPGGLGYERSLLQTNLINNTFRGVGPTIAIEGKRAIGDCGLSFYGLGRGSMLFGTNRFSNQAFQQLANGSFDASDLQFKTQTVLPILELELGAEWAPCCPCCVQPVFRVGLVSQTWFGAGSPTSTSGNLGLIGLTASAGLNF